MGAKELLDSGNLSGAIDQLTQDVKLYPRELKSRIFLFELLCFAGELQRAGRQLDAIVQTSEDVKIEMGAQVYRGALQAETARQSFHTGANRSPKFLSEPPPYTLHHLNAAEKFRENKLDELALLLEESGRVQTELKGQCNAMSFEHFRDGDDLLGPFLEVYFQTDYYWVPFAQIKRLVVQSPRTLRDLIWTPASLELSTSATSDVLIPVQYYGSHQHPDDLVKLGRMTDWKPIGSDILLGVGQRTFLAGETEYPLLEVRTVEFTSNNASQSRDSFK